MSRNKNKLPFKKWTAWNNVPDKPEGTNCISKPGDIVAKIGQIWFLLQRENDINNIVIFRQPGKFMPQMDVYRCIAAFIYRVVLFTGVRYFTIHGKKGRYDFLVKLFDTFIPGQDDNDTGEQFWYFFADDTAIAKLKYFKKGF